MFIEDDPVMVNSMIDDTCGLDGEGTGTRSGEDVEWRGMQMMNARTAK